MYFPYAEALLPFQPAGLKRKIQVRRPRREASYSDSEKEVIEAPRRIDLAAKLRSILDEETEKVDFAEDALGLPSISLQSRSSSIHSSNSPKRRIPLEPPCTSSQFLQGQPRGSKAFRHATHSSSHTDTYQTAEDFYVRSEHRVTLVPLQEAVRTDSLYFQSQLNGEMRKESLKSVPESNTHSSPALALLVPAPPKPNLDLCESESANCLPEKPKSVQVRVRKHKQTRAVTKSPKASIPAPVPAPNPLPERRIMTAVPCESRSKPGAPSVAEKQVDAQYREEMLDVLLKNKASQDHSSLMVEYVKRVGLPEQTRIFILNSQDEYVRRALKKRGWQENKVVNSSAFHLKWTYSDSDQDYRTLKPGQYFNHFANNRRLTTKCGLNSCFRANTDFALNPDTFFPRTYDLGDSVQVEEMKADYERTAAVGVIKHHAEYFLSLSQRSDPPSPVNTLCLRTALKYCKELVRNCKDKCELESKYSFVPAAKRGFVCSKEEWRLLMEYSKLRLPFGHLTDEIKLKSTRKSDLSTAWQFPSLRLSSKVTSLHSVILATFPQAAMEGSRNVWIVKPGQNARGSGVHCCSQLEEIVDCGVKLQARIVQKYLERPLLLTVPRGKVKFDIRQWVLVTSFDPLEVHFFNSCYLRLCTQPFTLDDLKDKFSHLANYSVQKTQSKAADETVWSLSQFLTYLSHHRPDISYSSDILPLLHSLVISTLQCAADEIDHRNCSFELYGFDIILDETMRPWLLEVNLSPACAERTPWLTSMLDEMMEGLVKVVVDGEKWEQELPIDTNQWQFIYKGVSNPVEVKDTPPCNLEIVGERANIRKEKLLERKLIREQAGALLQKVAKGFLVRSRNKHERRRTAAIAIQARVRRHLAVCELARRKQEAAILVLQCLYRSFEAKEALILLRKVVLVTTLQSLFRRKKAQERAKHMRICVNSSLIQRTWRQRIAQWKCNSERFFLRKVTQIQHWWKGRFAYRSKNAVKIQTRWRTVLACKAALKMRILVRNTHLIQSTFRQFLASEALKDAQITKNAMLIQVLFRRLASQQVLQRQREFRAASFILRKYKSYKARRVYLRIRRAKAARARAAIRIQATIKGHAARLEFARKREEKAALGLQRLFRGFVCRRYCAIVRVRDRAARVIQRHFRGYYTRKRAEMLRRIRKQEKERIRRKEQIRKEAQSRGVAASDRLSQRATDLLLSRQSPVNTTLSSLPRELARRPSAKEGKARSRLEVTPPPREASLLFEGMELLPRPGKKARVRTAYQDGKRPARY